MKHIHGSTWCHAMFPPGRPSRFIVHYCLLLVVQEGGEGEFAAAAGTG